MACLYRQRHSGQVVLSVVKMLYVGLNYGLFSTECGTVQIVYFTCVLGTVILAKATADVI